MTLMHLLGVLLTVTLWGLSFVAVRWGLDQVSPLTLTLLRFALAGLPLLPFVPRPRSSWWLLAAYGTVGFALMYLLLFGGMALGMPAGLSSLVVQSQVFFTIALAALFAGQRPQRLQWIAALVAAAGILMVGTTLPGGGSLRGLACVLGAAAAWGCANLLVRRIADDPVPTVVWASSFATVPLLLVSLLTEGPGRLFTSVAALSLRGWLGVAFQVWPATLLAFAIWARLLRIYPAAVVAPFALLIPVVGIGSSDLLLGESMGPAAWAGAALVLAGLALNVAAFRRSTTRPPDA